jgi:hypothetical protein
MVERLTQWHEQNHEQLEARGLAVRFGRSPKDGRDKASAWLIIEGPSTEAEIIIWDNGECDLFGPLREIPTPGTDPRSEHRQLATEQDFDAAIQRLQSIF